MRTFDGSDLGVKRTRPVKNQTVLASTEESNLLRLVSLLWNPFMVFLFIMLTPFTYVSRMPCCKRLLRTVYEVS